MLTIDFKARLRNKAFWVALISAIVLLVQQLGFKEIIPSNYADIANSILTVLTMFGIVVDTSTKGISDQVVSNATVQAINQANEVKTESTTTAINNTISEKSQGDSDNSLTTTTTNSSDKEATVDTATVLQENANLKATINQLNSVLNPLVTDNSTAVIQA